ncbi:MULTISPECIES: PepSY domain-containing protein [unclassified Bradyrhizobium]
MIMRLHCLLRLTRPALLVALISLASVASAAPRDGDRERWDAMRRAVESGDALPLAQILSKLRGRLGGDVTGIDIEHERGRWVYEFRVIGRDGRVLAVHVDPHSGEIEWIVEK